MRLPITQIDAFATKAFEGNPAAVMPLADWLDDATLLAIAAENNLSETAFIVASADEDVDFDLRWFTRETLSTISDEAFREYLNECCYDLHYAPISHARLFPFGLGNLWRIAVDYPGSPVPPCIHRAPDTLSGQPARLLLIS